MKTTILITGVKVNGTEISYEKTQSMDGHSLPTQKVKNEHLTTFRDNMREVIALETQVNSDNQKVNKLVDMLEESVALNKKIMAFIENEFMEFKEI